MGAVDDWNARQRELKEQRAVDEVRLNPHQFGDQMTLFDAPLGQPDAGTFNGNPNARMYRAVGVHADSVGVYRDPHGFGYEAPPDFHQRLLDNISRNRKDAGHDVSMGIHWQHSLPYAHDYANDLDESGVHGSRNFPVIIEADHPGNEHVIDRSTEWTRDPIRGTNTKPVPPKELGKDPDGRGVPRNKLTGHAKDWSLINDTVGPHSEDAWMVPEVPIRPGAPLRVHAIHTPDPENRGSYIRNPVRFDGRA